MSKKMFTPGSGGGSKPTKPKPRPESYLPSYLTVYVKPSPPPAEDPIPNDIVTFVPPTPQPAPPSSTSTYDPRPDSQTPGGKPAKKENKQRPQTKAQSKPDYDPLSSIQEPVAEAFSLPDFPQHIASGLQVDLEMEDNWRQEFKLHQLQMEYDDDLVRGVALSLQHEGLIDLYLHDPIAYLKNFAEYGWDEESDRMAEEFLLRYLEIYEPGTAYDIVQQTIADLTNDERESVVAIDLETGDQVFVRIGDGDSVALQDFHQKLAKGRNILVIHNHPNSTGASLADLGVAEWLDAEFMIVVRPDGYQHGYVGGEDGMARLAPSFNPDYLAAADPEETVAATFAYWIQSLLEIGNPVERVMRQEERDPRIHEQSFQSEAAQINPNYVRYSEPVPPRNVFERLGMQQLQKGYATEAGNVYFGAIVSGIFGNDDASHNLRHFLDGSGDPIDDLPVDKMIEELPLFREDIIQNVRDSLVRKFESGELEPIDVSEESTTYAYPTEWRFVGSEGKASADVYGFSEKSLDRGYNTFNMLTANPPEGVEQAEYDWYLALGKFYYSVRVNVTVNNETQDAELVMQIEVQDRYAWYPSKDVGEINHQMADLELVGEGRNFAISGESGVIEVSFNLKGLEAGREEPLFDWPEDG